MQTEVKMLQAENSPLEIISSWAKTKFLGHEPNKHALSAALEYVSLLQGTQEVFWILKLYKDFTL